MGFRNNERGFRMRYVILAILLVLCSVVASAEVISVKEDKDKVTIETKNTIITTKEDLQTRLDNLKKNLTDLEKKYTEITTSYEKNKKSTQDEIAATEDILKRLDAKKNKNE